MNWGFGVKGRALLALAAAIALSACGKSGPPPISAGDRYVGSADFDEAYKLGSGDKVRMTVFSEPQLSGDYSVSGDGELSLPLIGNVAVAGKTTSQASTAIQARFADGYLRNPRISMEVTTYRPFFILGEVKSPGQYPYASGMTALNAIAIAQGYTPRARKKRVFIRRFGEQLEQEYVVTPDLRVWPGDTIRLAERYF
ncbi:polysaccharide biosynthesis/export family protein [soil metagenome]